MEDHLRSHSRRACNPTKRISSDETMAPAKMRDNPHHLFVPGKPHPNGTLVIIYFSTKIPASEKSTRPGYFVMRITAPFSILFNANCKKAKNCLIDNTNY